jgi:cell division protein FtsB
MEKSQIAASQILFPVTLLALSVVGFLGFQAVMLSGDNANLQQTVDQQITQLEQVEKVKTQLNALASGTLKLSQMGDKDATAIIAQMRKAGVNIDESPKNNAAPAASTPTPPQPAK